MRLIVLFDLPVGTKAERRKAQKFRDLLLKEGFIMMQFSCYSKFCRNDSEVSKYIRRINGLSTLFRTIFIRSFFYILQVFYNLVIHEYECYCTNSHNQINLFLALQNF